MQGKYLDSLTDFTDGTFTLSQVLSELRINFQRVGFKRGDLLLLAERLNNWSALLIMKWNGCLNDKESGWIDR